MAVKYLNRRQTRKEDVETEFNSIYLLQHENLVQLYDLYETASNLLIVMELLVSLGEFCCNYWMVWMWLRIFVYFISWIFVQTYTIFSNWHIFASLLSHSYPRLGLRI